LPDTIAAIETFCLKGRRAEGPWGPPYGFFVKVVTSDGLVGLGESDTMPAIAAAAIGAPYFNPLVTGLRPLLIGSDTEPSAAWKRMREAVVQYGRDGVVIHAMAAIDIALWDIAGKRSGRSVADLLGGMKHGRLRCYGTHPLGTTLAETVENARKVLEQGFTAVKFGWPPLGADPEGDEAIVRTLRGAIGPSVDLLIDGGMAWDVTTAVARAERFRPYDIFWLEEPLAAYDVEGYQALRKTVGVPIAAGEMAASAAELMRLIRAGGVDVVQIDVSRTGLTQGIEIARYAAEHGVAVVNHTYGYQGNAAASAQLMAASPLISLFECQASTNDLRDALDQAQLRPKDGWIDVPNGPGLGIDIDERVLRHYSETTA
jgi:L-rhamnonate dehydratase